MYAAPKNVSRVPPKGFPQDDAAPAQSQKSGAAIEPIVAFYIFFAAHAVAAIFSPILDCDEVYQYWEPTHYLAHGYGMQSWEYSPDFAIRSWAYAGLHAIIVGIGRLTPFGHSKAGEFYFLRIFLGFVCALCETQLFAVVSRVMSPRIGMIFLVISVTAAGMFHASVAYLPSSFAMYCTMLGLASFMDWRGGLRTASGIMWFGIGGIVGWPFASALVIPFVGEEILMMVMTNELEAFHRLLDGTVRSLLVLALQFAIDVFFYKKIACVPWNIIQYNIFSGSAKGPALYGTEPWHYYAMNLLINFNIWFVLALATFPLIAMQHLGNKQAISRLSFFRTLVFVAPFYMWLGIFTLQPHKEERFMYPAYPALALNAAISAHILLTWIGSKDPRSLVSRIPGPIKFYILTLIAILAIEAGILRSVGLATGYTAPLSVYSPLREPGVAHSGDNVCLSKEWYRFPSSYHLGHATRAKFVKSEFSGLLPGEFSEASTGFGLYPGAWLIPPGMNDENQEDMGKYTDIAQCHFLVDSQFSSNPPSELEPDYISDTAHWEALKCKPFLDTGSTGLIGRMLWVPDWNIIPAKYRRQYGRYCLLRRKV